jgi:hypothetical protein
MTRPLRKLAPEQQARHKVLMTADDARWALGRSAIACIKGLSCGYKELWAVLHGAPVQGLEFRDRSLARAHTRVLAAINAAGHGYLIEDELEGIGSATGLDEGELRDITAVEETFADEPDDPRMAG